MFYGYIDESGGRELITLSCLAGHWSQLFWMEAKWQNILEKRNKVLQAQGRRSILRFHASDWEMFAGWSKKEIEEFITELVALFHQFPVVGSSETIRRQDIIDVFPEADEQDRVDHLAHTILLTYLVSYFDSKLLNDKRYLTDRIALIHDQSNLRAVLKDTFESLKNDTGIKNRDRFVSIESKTWQEETLLQAADLVAYENFKVIERKNAGKDMRIPMKQILESSKFGGRNAMVTKAGLQEFRAKADNETLRVVFTNARILDGNT
jgi:Protein of unknown function (DUF3800)